MHGENRGPLVECRQRDSDLPVEPAWAEQRWIEHLGTVGGREYDEALGHVEAVHLGQQLVQGLLAFVIGHDRARARAALADRVDLVDENDRRSSLARLAEQ